MDKDILYQKLFPVDGKQQVWVLIDPDTLPLDQLIDRVCKAESEGVSAILIGGSFLSQDNFDNTVMEIKAACNIPVVIFPGSSRQLSKYADGILFTSLLSGRNPQYLIGEQVMAAPFIVKMGLAAIPTAYLLIESGSATSAQFVSNTQPIPRTKPQLAVAHAMAAELFGMKAVYLEAGSGADMAVPASMIRAVVRHINIPVIAGGGIRNVEDAHAAMEAGASVIVIGTAVEQNGLDFMHELLSGINNFS
ncbi:MAG: geranylgeranylglyceryl/heptaprenylglyceryl phosphate synthase [Calditrichaeota bacterium]|nr:geranylgeranylglyceryl/heptaprenylglyceryl phosphate synthase [Calditrichota bacterium]MBT7788364.1 geranylgeranylglyceryl/heptaprenylglyceryl phosphate synthase [Calditrichota bacterium]